MSSLHLSLGTRRQRRRLLKSTILHIVLIISTLLIVTPFLWLFATSIKNVEEIFTRVPRFIPNDPTLENYRYIFRETPIPRYFSTAVIGTVLTCLAAYALSRFRFRGKIGYMTMLLVTQMFPAALFLAPLYIVLRNYHLINTPWALIFSYSTFVIPFCTWMLKGYFDGIPTDLEESAMVDGASRLTAMRTILLPLAAPGLATAVLFAFLLGWQEFMFAIAYVQSDNLRTLPVGIALMQSTYGVAYGYLMAAAVVVTIPIIILFAFLQRFLIRGLTAGAVKG